MLGMYAGHTPRFVKRYAEVAASISEALEAYVHDVKSGTFPEEQHSYSISDEELELFQTALAEARSS
jgi:3-methyl-2-oxobutanoate hydroxymethyltransferase